MRNIREDAGEHLNQDRLAGARMPSPMKVEEKAAESTKGFIAGRSRRAISILASFSAGYLGDVVADDLLGLLEGHHQGLRFCPGATSNR